MGRPGTRKDTFYAVNCASYKADSQLLESELFGYVKGAFTGADKNHDGIFVKARGGSVFLDEIHHLSLESQAKLLRLLQDYKLRPIGGHQEIAVNVRVIVAAKQNLNELVKNGKFLEDLYYRIHVLRIEVPPLRERRGDIDLLLDHFLNQFYIKTEKRIIIAEPAKRLLRVHAWPGNVRELKNLLERLCTNAKTDVIDIEVVKRELEIDVQIECYEQFKNKQERDEFSFIKSILESCDFNKKKAATKLGVSPSTLHSKMARLGLKEH